MTGFGKRSNFPHLYPLFFLHGGGLKIAAKRDIMLIIERMRLPAQQKAAASGCNTAPFFCMWMRNIEYTRKQLTADIAGLRTV